MSRSIVRKLCAGAVFFLLSASAFAGDASFVASRQAANTILEVRRMPAEFEPQRAIYLSAGSLSPQYAATIAQISRAVRRNVNVVVLAAGEDRALIEKELGETAASKAGVEFVDWKHDTRWIRDFGPTILHADNLPVAVDWVYDQDRARDDDAPRHIARHSGMACEADSLRIEGGNLLSNGRGLCVTTTAFINQNSILEISDEDLRQSLRTRLGARDVILLEPLAGESTGHVDMFLTFVRSNLVVVGSYSYEEDDENAAILDRNAAILESLTTPDGPMEVVRIPMGGNFDGVWRTYTNCIYANGVLLLPAYEKKEAANLRRAKKVFQRLLPDWEIAAIDCVDLIEQGGALHCVSLNVPAAVGVPPMPPQLTLKP